MAGNEFLLVSITAIVVISSYVIAVKKIINSKMSSNQKVSWIFTIFIFNIFGLVGFLIYHEHYLHLSLRGEVRW
jgi:hypothetical protein